MPPKMWIKNPEEIKRAFAQLDQLTQTRYLSAAVNAGMLPIQNEAAARAPYLTGTLRRSIHSEIVISRPLYCEGAIGTNLEYAARIEFGFQETDSLGRSYDQPAKPYLRPAFDEKRREAVGEIADSLTAILQTLV